MAKSLIPGGLAVLSLCSLLSLGTLAGDKGSDDGRVDKLTDEQFVQKAAAADLVEITTGKIAVEHANNSEVKKYAQQMIDDHTRSSKELLAIADKKAIKVVVKIDPKHQDAMAKLIARKGADFDRAYLEQMVKDHKMVLSMYQNQAKNGKDEDLKAFAAKGAPIVAMHLKMATDLHARLADGKGTE